MKLSRFSLFHPLWPAVALLAGLILIMTLTSAEALPASPDSPDIPSDVPGGIEGTLYPPPGTAQTPIAWGWIDIHDEHGQPWMGTDTDENGDFEIANLPPGNYILNAFPPPDPPGAPYAASDAVMVEVLSGQWVVRDLHLTWPKVSGWVEDCETNERIGGIPVVVHDDNDPWTLERWDETNPDGEFKIGGTVLVTGTTYILEAFPPPESGYAPAGRPVVPITTGVVLQVCVPPTNVVGIVHNPAGDPVPGAGVVVHQDEFWRETATDKAGNFLFRDLPPGDFKGVAAPPWGPAGEGLISSPPFTFVITQTDITLVDLGVITLPNALKTASGKVFYAGTTDIVTNAVVVAHRLDRPGFADQPVVSTSGVFTLGLPGGEWHLAVEPLPPPAPPPPPPDWIFSGPPAWIAFMEPISITEEITGVDLEVVRTNATVKGHVVCPGGGECSPGDLPHWDVWVELRSDEIHHGTELNPDYDFAIPIPDGWYELVVHVDHPELQGPEPMPIFVGPNQTLILQDPIQLWPKDARIIGQVRNQAGIGIEGVPVIAWQPKGFGWGWAETKAGGVYTMPVIPGEWFVEPQPTPEMNYVFRHRPRLVRVLPHSEMKGVDFVLTNAGSRILGIAIDAERPEEGRLWGLDGWARAVQFHAPGDSEFFSDAPLWDGGFELKVKGGFTYVAGLDLPPRAPFVSGHTPPIPVDVGELVTTVVPLERKNAVIEGPLIIAGSSPPEPAHGVWAEVFGHDERGNWTGVQVDPESAWYEMAVVSGTWHMRAWVDPVSRYVAVPTATLVSVEAGRVVSQPFEVWPIGSSIRGQVLEPDGTTPVPGAFVFAEGESFFAGYFEAFTETNATGHFNLPVLDGVYRVGAALPDHELEAQGWLNPPPIEPVTSTVPNPAPPLELRFRQLDGLITGTVTFAGVGVTPTHPAYIWGWAENGAWAETEAGFISGTKEFTYSMWVISDTVWHVGAVYDDWDNGYFYESPEEVLPDLSTTGGRARQDLVLGAPQQMPQPFIVSFDGSQMQTIIMPDGVELSIPAGSLVTSGTVTLFIFPTKGLRPEEGQEIIGVGYEIWAVDQNGQEITQFNQNVMMTFPYPPDAVLKAHGVSEYMLVPVYYSTLVGQWILADSYTVDTNNNEIMLQISHFTKFGALSTSKEYEIYLPLILRSGS